MGIKSADNPSQYGYLNRSILSVTPPLQEAASWQQYMQWSHSHTYVCSFDQISYFSARSSYTCILLFYFYFLNFFLSSFLLSPSCPIPRDEQADEMLSYVDCEKLVMMCTANQGPLRIQHKWLVPIYVFLMMWTANEGLARIQYKWLVPFTMYSQKWNCGASLFPKQNYNVLSPSS